MNAGRLHVTWLKKEREKKKTKENLQEKVSPSQQSGNSIPHTNASTGNTANTKVIYGITPEKVMDVDSGIKDKKEKNKKKKTMKNRRK